MTPEKLSYYQQYRLKNLDKCCAAQQKWAKSEKGIAYTERKRELRKQRCLVWRLRKANSERLAEEEMKLAELLKQFPRAITGPRKRYTARESEVRRKATTRKARYKGQITNLQSIEDYIDPGACQICGSTEKVSLDHCHSSKVFRGWLCNSCNLVLGLVGDQSRLLRKLAEYVENQKGIEFLRRQIAS